MMKRAEIVAKSTFKNATIKEISAMAPGKYADRFIDFMKNTVFDGYRFDFSGGDPTQKGTERTDSFFGELY